MGGHENLPAHGHRGLPTVGNSPRFVAAFRAAKEPFGQHDFAGYLAAYRSMRDLSTGVPSPSRSSSAPSRPLIARARSRAEPRTIGPDVPSQGVAQAKPFDCDFGISPETLAMAVAPLDLSSLEIRRDTRLRESAKCDGIRTAASGPFAVKLTSRRSDDEHGGHETLAAPKAGHSIGRFELVDQVRGEQHCVKQLVVGQDR
jgi:hypothetical protein